MLVKSSFCSSNILTDRVVFVWISSLAFFFFSILLTNFFCIPPDYILRIQECNSWHCSCSWTSYNTWHCSSILWRTLPPWASVMLQSLGSPSAFLSFFFLLEAPLGSLPSFSSSCTDSSPWTALAEHLLHIRSQTWLFPVVILFPA